MKYVIYRDEVLVGRFLHRRMRDECLVTMMGLYPGAGWERGELEEEVRS